VGGKRSAEQRRRVGERSRERSRRQACEQARERASEPPAPGTPKAVLSLERIVGRDGVARALALVGRWRRACIEVGVPTEGLDGLVYRESLEMVALDLADDPPAPPREAVRSYAPLYDNREG